jgi:hypothetical protein
MPPVTLELEEEARPFHGWAYPNPRAHDGMVRQECNQLCKEEALEKDSNLEWAVPTFRVPKKE